MPRDYRLHRPIEDYPAEFLAALAEARGSHPANYFAGSPINTNLPALNWDWYDWFVERYFRLRPQQQLRPPICGAEACHIYGRIFSEPLNSAWRWVRERQFQSLAQRDPVELALYGTARVVVIRSNRGRAT